MSTFQTTLPGVIASPSTAVGPGSGSNSGSRALASLAGSVIGLVSQVQRNQEDRRAEEERRQRELQANFLARQRADLAETDAVRREREAEERIRSQAGQDAVRGVRPAFEIAADTIVSQMSRDELSGVDTTDVRSMAALAEGVFADRLARIGEPETPEYVAALDEMTGILSARMTRAQTAEREASQSDFLRIVSGIAASSGVDAARRAAGTLGLDPRITEDAIAASLSDQARAAAISGDPDRTREMAVRANLSEGDTAALLDRAQTAQRQNTNRAQGEVVTRAEALVVQGDIQGALGVIGASAMFSDDEKVVESNRLMEKYRRSQATAGQAGIRAMAQENANAFVAQNLVRNALGGELSDLDAATVSGAGNVAIVGDQIVVQVSSDQAESFDLDPMVRESLSASANLAMAAARESGLDVAQVASDYARASQRLRQPLPDSVARMFRGFGSRISETGDLSDADTESIRAYRAVRSIGGGVMLDSLDAVDRDALSRVSLVMDGSDIDEASAVRMVARTMNTPVRSGGQLDTDVVMGSQLFGGASPSLLARGVVATSRLSTLGLTSLALDDAPQKAVRRALIGPDPSEAVQLANRSVYGPEVRNRFQHLGAIDAFKDNEDISKQAVKEVVSGAFAPRSNGFAMVSMAAMPTHIRGERSAMESWVTQTRAGIYEREVLRRMEQSGDVQQVRDAMSRIAAISPTASPQDRIKVVEREARKIHTLSGKAEAVRSPFVGNDGKFVSFDRALLMSTPDGSSIFLIDAANGESLTGNLVDLGLSPQEQAARARRAFDEARLR